MQGDLNSKDSLREAFKGAYAVYAVTNYWEKEDAELEMQQGRNLADVAKVSVTLIQVPLFITLVLTSNYRTRNVESSISSGVAC